MESQHRIQTKGQIMLHIIERLLMFLHVTRPTKQSKSGKKRTLSAEARKKMAAAQKARWAAKKAAAAAQAPVASDPPEFKPMLAKDTKAE